MRSPVAHPGIAAFPFGNTRAKIVTLRPQERASKRAFSSGTPIVLMASAKASVVGSSRRKYVFFSRLSRPTPMTVGATLANRPEIVTLPRGMNIRSVLSDRSLAASSVSRIIVLFSKYRRTSASAVRIVAIAKAMASSGESARTTNGAGPERRCFRTTPLASSLWQRRTDSVNGNSKRELYSFQNSSVLRAPTLGGKPKSLRAYRAATGTHCSSQCSNITASITTTSLQPYC